MLITGTSVLIMGPNPTLSHVVNRTAKANNTTLKMSAFFDNFNIQILQRYLKKKISFKRHEYTLVYPISLILQQIKEETMSYS